MLENIVAGLVLMGINAIAFVAYKYPDFYREKLNFVLFVIFSVYVCLSVYNSTIKYSFYKLEKYIPEKKRIVAYNSLMDKKIPETYLLFLTLGIVFFLIFLGLLKTLRNKN